MGSYKAYLEQGLDLCPKIYLQEDPDPPPDDASRQFAYERGASSRNPTHASQDTESARDYIATSSIPTRASEDTEFARDYVASSSIPTRSSQDTRFALTTPSSNRTQASQDLQITPDIFPASPSNPTRPSQYSELARSITTNSSHDSQGDLTTSSNNLTPSIPRSNPLPSHPSHLPDPQPLHSQSLNLKDRNPSPPPAPPQPQGPCPPCAKRLWSKVLRAPPPPEPLSPRTPGLWIKVLCSSTTPPPAPDTIESEAPKPHGLFTRRRRSSVPLLDLPPAELLPKVTEKECKQERRQSSPMLVSARTETWPPRTRQKSHDPPFPNHPDPDTQTTVSHFLPRLVHSSSPHPQTPIHTPPSPSTPYPAPYSLTTKQYDNASLSSLQQNLTYTFTTPTLLLQALTPPTPGHSNNARLSYLGRRAMELVLWESCYTLRLSERAAREAVARALGVEMLVGAGLRCGLGAFVGGRGGDLAGEVRRGVLAVVGGVYLDGGVGGVRKVMGGLGVGIGRGR
ncbi:hypothetical protein VE02_04693 [Pseudogymnoascus sp. 03VT05]|nr:hypothetical protein VE02_04693 [Pseudogymnoascus sp. 03VT05]